MSQLLAFLVSLVAGTSLDNGPYVDPNGLATCSGGDNGPFIGLCG